MRRFAALSALFGFCLIALTAYAMDWKDIHETADRIALSEAREYLVAHPDSREALYLLGLVLLNYYEINEAWDVFGEMIKKDPSGLEGRWGRAEILRRRHQIDEAEGILEALIKEDPDYAPAYITLAYMLFDKKEYQRSIRLAVQVLRMGRSNVDTTNIVRAYLTIGGAKGMIADEGGAFSKLVQGTQVLGYLKRAQQLQPNAAGVLFGLGSFYALAPPIAGGDVDKGLLLLEEVLKVDPNFVDAYGRLAQVYFRRGDEELARRYLTEAKKMDPENSLTRRADKEINAPVPKKP